jgi:hypothetical protein
LVRGIQGKIFLLPRRKIAQTQVGGKKTDFSPYVILRIDQAKRYEYGQSKNQSPKSLELFFHIKPGGGCEFLLKKMTKTSHLKRSEVILRIFSGLNPFEFN